MAGPNLLIGNGEALTGGIERRKSVNTGKVAHYTIEQARERLAPQIDLVIEHITALPGSAKPRGEGVGIVTVHPAYLAKTQMPDQVFRAAGLRSLGSCPASVVPSNDARKTAILGTSQPTAELYLSGTSEAFKEFRSMLLSDSSSNSIKDQFCRLEAVRGLSSQERLLRLDGEDQEVRVELVVHGEAGDLSLLHDLEMHAKSCRATLAISKRLEVPGLIFMPGVVPRGMLAQFAQFSALRAVRRLPFLRLNRPVIRQRLTTAAPALPDADAADPTIKVVAFDGGLGVQDFSRWCVESVPNELHATHADYLSHGAEVTSALLFGEVAADATTLPVPYFNVEHHRVVGAADELDVDLYECMQRIDAVLGAGDVDFANLSLGPRLAIDDGHPHAWTAMLDGHLATGRTLVTVAAGNDGNLLDGLGRIQPPADAINALSVGAADSASFLWNRAHYSCHGPGRSPGLIKPDGLAFGGTDTEPLVLLNPFAGGLTSVQGTSFGSPLVLRVAAAARASVAVDLSATALRALLIHRAERAASHNQDDVGWGRFPSSLEELLVCDDHEATVLYQGHIAAGGALRATLPIPPVPLGTGISIKATFCFASPVDPADPVNYTRHGLTVVFRPRGEGSTQPFFSTGNYDSEQDLRRDAYKWETVLNRATQFKAEELLSACFDIEHGAREHGLRVTNKNVPSLPYVLLITITSDRAEPIYQQVLQRYKALLPVQLREHVRLRT